MNRLRRLVLLLLSAVALSPALAQADQLNDIESHHLLRVAVPQDFPPFGSIGPDLQPVGYDIDTAKLIAKQMGVQLQLVPVTSANRIAYLTSGKVDLVISSLGKNPEREKVMDFSDPYAPFYNGVFGTPDVKGASGPALLADHSVAVTRGSIEDLELTKIAPPNATIKRYEDNNATITAFLSGQTDLIATGNVVAAAIMARNPQRRPEIKFLIKNSPCVIGLAKNEPRLLARVNGILAAARKDGSLDAISMHWLGMHLPKDF